MTGGEYLFNKMAKSLGGSHLPYHLQPVNIREAMEDAYQDIRLKMFGSEGKEWAANAVVRRGSNSGLEELRALNGKLSLENSQLQAAKELMEQRARTPVLLIEAPQQPAEAKKRGRLTRWWGWMNGRAFE